MSGYIVLTRMSYGFDNVWLENDEPQVFASRADARAEILDHVQACQALEDAPRLSDFKIVKEDN